MSERLAWVLGSCTVLVVVCQLLVLCLYPLLAPRKQSEINFQRLTGGTQTTEFTWVSLCFPSELSEWAALVESFFIGLALSTLVCDSIFHLIPDALLNPDSPPNITRLGFCSISGMLLVLVVETLVHSDLKLVDVFGLCPIGVDVENEERFELSDVHHHHHHAAADFCSHHGFSHLVLEQQIEEDYDQSPRSEKSTVVTSQADIPKGRRSSVASNKHCCILNDQPSLTELPYESAEGWKTSEVFQDDNDDGAPPMRPTTAPAAYDEKKLPKFPKSHPNMKLLRTTAWTNLIAECLHNIIDGLAIGIAFSSGTPSVGIATTLAIFAHEVPSQIADFIILLRGGFPPLIAYSLNFLVAFGIHIGAVLALIGTPASYHSAVQMIAAGNFLCLGLSLLLPQLRDIINHSHSFHYDDRWSTKRRCLSASVGLIGGCTLIAFFTA